MRAHGCIVLTFEADLVAQKLDKLGYGNPSSVIFGISIDLSLVVILFQ